MKLKIKAEHLKEMVSRAIKGVGNNKLIPITSLMAIELRNGKLTLITTDATNYLYIKKDKVEGKDFYVVVPVEVFSKLVMKMTCETVEMELKSNCLEVRGNGNYSIELPLDEDGELVRYPDPMRTVIMDMKPTEISNATIVSILNSVKPALAATLEIPCYTGYYVGDTVVATDTYKISALKAKLLEEPRLISPEMMNLLAVFTTEKINVCVMDSTIVFYNDDCVVYGTSMEGLEEYQIEAISALVDTEFVSKCKIAKTHFLQLLDRLSLFVGTYDKNAVVLTFTEKGLQVSSKASSGVELIPYIESENFEDFICSVDIETLTSQVKGQASETIELYYGLDNAIKMVDGDITQIVSLLADGDDE